MAKQPWQTAHADDIGARIGDLAARLEGVPRDGMRTDADRTIGSVAEKLRGYADELGQGVRTGWVDAEECVPPYHQAVLVCNASLGWKRSGAVELLPAFVGDEKRATGPRADTWIDSDGIRLAHVTHWRPWPELPKP